MYIKIDHNIGSGVLDALRIKKCGLLSLEGWYRDTDMTRLKELKLMLNGHNVKINDMFRTYRPDVTKVYKDNNDFFGFEIDFLIDEFNKGFSAIDVFLEEEKIFSTKVSIDFEPAAYNSFLNEEKVLHRDDIYGYGAPSLKNCDEVISMAKMLDGPVLDFGCGSGYLVKSLRESGVEAFGIEIDRSAIIESLYHEAKDYITLYDGSLPLPYKDEEFLSVISSEVLEHIPNYNEVIDEIARITRKNFVTTVPDISSIPMCFHAGVVPWHMLESTHVNFFTQRSLEKCLSSRFNVLSISKIGPTVTNDIKWFGNLVAVCEKK